MKAIKPMLAASQLPSIEQIQFPILGSYKLDGIRCILRDGICYSRSGKLIPNKHIQKVLSKLPNYLILDGELMVDGDFNDVQSCIMSREGEPKFTYNIFDCVADKPYFQRHQMIKEYNMKINNVHLRLVDYLILRDENDLKLMYEGALEKGYEGLILRSKHSPYKHGRSTLNQGWMLKMKPISDAEGTVIAAHEMMHNFNDEEVNELGYQSRGHSKFGLVPAGVLGSLELRFEGEIVKVGSGYDYNQRSELWKKHLNGELIGKKVTFKHLGLSKYGVPRGPIFKGIRLD